MYVLGESITRARSDSTERGWHVKRKKPWKLKYLVRDVGGAEAIELAACYGHGYVWLLAFIGKSPATVTHLTATSGHAWLLSTVGTKAGLTPDRPFPFTFFTLNCFMAAASVDGRYFVTNDAKLSVPRCRATDIFFVMRYQK